MVGTKSGRAMSAQTLDTFRTRYSEWHEECLVDFASLDTRFLTCEFTQVE